MKPYTRYSEAFKEQALAKVYSLKSDQTLQDVAVDLNVSLQTLKKWIKKTELNHPNPRKSKRPQDWQPEERLVALHQTYELPREAVNAWCREQGLFSHHLEQWKADFCQPSNASEQRLEGQSTQALKAANQRLERELLRKDKALAEAAALLVLQKKFRALLGGEVE